MMNCERNQAQSEDDFFELPEQLVHVIPVTASIMRTIFQKYRCGPEVPKIFRFFPGFGR